MPVGAHQTLARKNTVNSPHTNTSEVIVIDPEFLVVGTQEFHDWPSTRDFGSTYRRTQHHAFINEELGVVARPSIQSARVPEFPKLHTIDIRVSDVGGLSGQFHINRSSSEAEIGICPIYVGKNYEMLDPLIDKQSFHMKVNRPGQPGKKIFHYEPLYDPDTGVLQVIQAYKHDAYSSNGEALNTASEGSNFVAKGYKEAAGKALFDVSILGLKATVVVLILSIIAYALYRILQIG